MIANKDKVGHNMEEYCLLQQPAKKQGLQSTRHKFCHHFHSKEYKFLCAKYLHWKYSWSANSQQPQLQTFPC